MEHVERRYPGVPRVMAGAVQEFVGFGFLFGVATVLYILPAIILALVVLPPLASYIILTASSFTIMLTGTFVRDDESELTVPEEVQELSPLQTLLYTTVTYTIAAGAVSGMFLWTASLAGLAAFVLGSPTLAVAIALIYPPIDRWFAHNFEVASVVVACGNVVAYIIRAVFEIYNFSKEIVDDAERQTAALY